MISFYKWEIMIFKIKTIHKQVRKKSKTSSNNHFKIWIKVFKLNSFRFLTKKVNNFWIINYFKKIKSERWLQKSFMLIRIQFRIIKANWKNIQFSILKLALLMFHLLKYKWKLLKSNSTRFQITQDWKSIKFLSLRIAIPNCSQWKIRRIQAKWIFKVSADKLIKFENFYP